MSVAVLAPGRFSWLWGRGMELLERSRPTSRSPAPFQGPIVRSAALTRDRTPVLRCVHVTESLTGVFPLSFYLRPRGYPNAQSSVLRITFCHQTKEYNDFLAFCTQRRGPPLSSVFYFQYHNIFWTYPTPSLLITQFCLFLTCQI